MTPFETFLKNEDYLYNRLLDEEKKFKPKYKIDGCVQLLLFLMIQFQVVAYFIFKKDITELC